jgi:hypothetical protein
MFKEALQYANESAACVAMSGSDEWGITLCRINAEIGLVALDHNEPTEVRSETAFVVLLIASAPVHYLPLLSTASLYPSFCLDQRGWVQTNA